jgi:hypothetical protein
MLAQRSVPHESSPTRLAEQAPTVGFASLSLVGKKEQTNPIRGAPSYERALSDQEASYYLPSRQEGVNDMCVPFVDSSTLNSNASAQDFLAS